MTQAMMRAMRGLWLFSCALALGLGGVRSYHSVSNNVVKSCLVCAVSVQFEWGSSMVAQFRCAFTALLCGFARITDWHKACYN